MIEVVVNDRLGKKIRIKCKYVILLYWFSALSWLFISPTDTIGDLKKIISLQTGTKPEKIRIQKWYNIFKDHITLEDYEIKDGMGLELYYN